MWVVLPTFRRLLLSVALRRDLGRENLSAHFPSACDTPVEYRWCEPYCASLLGTKFPEFGDRVMTEYSANLGRHASTHPAVYIGFNERN